MLEARTVLRRNSGSKWLRPTYCPSLTTLPTTWEDPRFRLAKTLLVILSGITWSKNSRFDEGPFEGQQELVVSGLDRPFGDGLVFVLQLSPRQNEQPRFWGILPDPQVCCLALWPQGVNKKPRWSPVVLPLGRSLPPAASLLHDDGDSQLERVLLARWLSETAQSQQKVRHRFVGRSRKAMGVRDQHSRELDLNALFATRCHPSSSPEALHQTRLLPQHVSLCQLPYHHGLNPQDLHHKCK